MLALGRGHSLRDLHGSTWLGFTERHTSVEDLCFSLLCGDGSDVVSLFMVTDENDGGNDEDDGLLFILGIENPTCERPFPHSDIHTLSHSEALPSSPRSTLSTCLPLRHTYLLAPPNIVNVPALEAHLPLKLTLLIKRTKLQSKNKYL